MFDDCYNKGGMTKWHSRRGVKGRKEAKENRREEEEQQESDWQRSRELFSIFVGSSLPHTPQEHA